VKIKNRESEREKDFKTLNNMTLIGKATMA
jgi:hypothetical protein